jgi:hypothetical protein
MAANVENRTTPLQGDARFRPRSYISNGRELYYVLGYDTRPVPFEGAPFRTLSAEDCATGETVQLDLIKVRRGCVLIDPAAYVP